MNSAVLDSPAMPRQKHPSDPGTLKRVPVKMDESTQDKLREMAVVWFRKPIELLAGEWLRERIESEYKKGRRRS